MQRLLAEVPTERSADYLATERRLGARWLGGSGRVTWLASFAPMGPCELRAFVTGWPRPPSWKTTATWSRSSATASLPR